ncbi:Crp/Fnr family transcriptional regulator [Pseudochrobactrum kiredjianiae]|uniref:Crp/Fnr family transcriptional regulator n=1 Tax=Pseudochrobactrum kiredjianiae TaxID=386305 RepID=A0ABW3V300_9HYPH|nr:Crp/Fnr family transcriptional regulator [Pseudochrobactrum kiredjianiae]MDM7853188.1 Crp/Fnr family transcriptional regulator [Pseudochrobactrum kiredjianiae]
MHNELHSINITVSALIELLKAPPILADFENIELKALAGLQVDERRIQADGTIINQGERIRSIHLVQSGWGCVYRDLSNGERQVLDFPMRSDFVGLRTAAGRSYNTVAAITPMSVFEVPLCSLANAIQHAPKLSFILIELFARQRSLLIEHLTNVGCRSALVRTAHLLLELGDRAKACGMGDENGFDCPITQYQLADALGLTPIHLNRMVRELREDGLLMFKNSRVDFLNRKALIALAEYDGEFMHMSVFDKTMPRADSLLQS